MSSRSMGSSNQQVVRPPQKGIFPLDHYGECQSSMQDYVDCLQQHNDAHYQCRDLSRAYLECRMQVGLMARENMADLGYRDDTVVRNAREYDHAKEKAGYVAGKHIAKESKWWWQTDPTNKKKKYEFGSSSGSGSNTDNKSSDETK